MGFNIEDIKISQSDFGEIAVSEVLSACEIRKPERQEFFRVHPDESCQVVVFAIKEKTGMREKLWLVHPALKQELSDELVPVNLRLVVNRDNKLFIWPLNISLNGNTNPWSQTALQAAENAKTKWVRMMPDQDEGKYRIYPAKGELPEPVWPEYTFNELVELAFAERIITDLDHPFLRRLRGEE